MNKSIEFIKRRIADGMVADWIPKDGWDNANVFNPYDILEFTDEQRQYQDLLFSFDGHETKGKIVYDPNADFDYISFEDCWHDGTLLFYQETRWNVASKPFALKTYNKNVAPDDFDCNSPESVYGYEYEFIIGDVVEVTEHKDSPFADKPWADSHTVVGMPIKMRFIKKEKTDESKNGLCN